MRCARRSRGRGQRRSPRFGSPSRGAIAGLTGVPLQSRAGILRSPGLKIFPASGPVLRGVKGDEQLAHAGTIS
jgi:hypothetical protein